ncbi:hypothetical protein GGF46_000229 [Coemansia sp. RSA 552]|nr:hypothetical protein GGF46_000229 [Coemansia sp. RSA 552]
MGVGSPKATKTTPEWQSYLHIFDRILHTVMQAEARLFSDREREILAAFSALDRHSRYLYTRVFMRKRAWIRVSSLRYGEGIVVEQSCKYLTAHTQEAIPFLQTEADIDDVAEVLATLTVPELRTLARARGIKQAAGKPKEALCAMLTKSTKQRTVTSFFTNNKADSTQQRKAELIQGALAVTGPLVRTDLAITELFERLHLVFFRSPVHLGDENPMRSAILAAVGQIRFPKYSVLRSPDLFESRESVVRFKALVEVGYEMEVLLTHAVKETHHHQKGWQIYLAHSQQWTDHLQILQSTSHPKATLGSDKASDQEEAVGYWRRHFTPGYALARIVERGARFAANLKQFADERDVLESLLAQDAYRVGRRGDWYERLVLLYTVHLRPKRAKADLEARELITRSLVTARGICIRALGDFNVHRVSLHAISRQLRNIEAKLELSEAEQYCHPRLCIEWKPVPERAVSGVRIRDYSRRGPSQWDGKDGVPCSVEHLALWRYMDLGYTGVHAENAIITTLFSLLFWEIIFYPIPGVLDTEYLSRPLDMASESFYYSRRQMIEERLQTIAAGDFEDGICSVYAEEQGSECVGVSWDITCDQLVTIAKGIGGRRLAAICRVLATEYRLKRSGFPDLCLWNNETGEVLFAEVKGPNDKLSETQHDWLDILLNNGIAVEVCYVSEDAA